MARGMIDTTRLRDRAASLQSAFRMRGYDDDLAWIVEAADEIDRLRAGAVAEAARAESTSAWVAVFLPGVAGVYDDPEAIGPFASEAEARRWLDAEPETATVATVVEVGSPGRAAVSARDVLAAQGRSVHAGRDVARARDELLLARAAIADALETLDRLRL